MSLQSWLLSCWYSARARLPCIARFTTGSKKSSITETKACARLDRKRPSFYLLAASLLLLISATIGLTGKPPELDNEAEALILRGWQLTERLPCPKQVAGRFYELEGENELVETYVQAPNKALTAKLPLPFPVHHCREISRPHFIEEIL